MPRDASGNYSLPAGNPVVTGTTISSTIQNNTTSDMATAFTDSLDRNGKGGMLAALALIDGVVGTPSITWTSDPDSGFYRIGSNNLGLALGGVKVADFTAALINFTPTAFQVNGVSVNNAAILTAGTLPDARFPATLPVASGVNLTALNATNLASGTVPDARFPATLPAASGVNLTALNATNLASGTVPDARFPATLPAVSGVNLTALNASNLASGSIASARVPAAAVTQHQASLSIATSQLTGNMPDARIIASNVTQHQSSLSLGASQIVSGTIANARLPNVGAMPGVTIQSDPGGTPSGAVGAIFLYY